MCLELLAHGLHGTVQYDLRMVDEGDMVVVRKQDHANYGDIVVALVDNETTLKTYYPEPENKRIRLHPENASMEDIVVRVCNIQGVAKHVIKKL